MNISQQIILSFFYYSVIHINHKEVLLSSLKSKFFISGDLEQTDRYKDKTQSGLWDAIEKFKNVSDIGVFEFNDKDIVRNPLISQILSKYEE